MTIPAGKSVEIVWIPRQQRSLIPNSRYYQMKGVITDGKAKLKDFSISISLAAKGKPWENSNAERLIRTLKDEEIYLHEYDDFTVRRLQF